MNALATGCASNPNKKGAISGRFYVRLALERTRSTECRTVGITHIIATLFTGQSEVRNSRLEWRRIVTARILARRECARVSHHQLASSGRCVRVRFLMQTLLISNLLHEIFSYLIVTSFHLYSIPGPSLFVGWVRSYRLPYFFFHSTRIRLRRVIAERSSAECPLCFALCTLKAQLNIIFRDKSVELDIRTFPFMKFI